MNNVFATAKVKENRIVYTYLNRGIPYEIETPITHLNQNIKDGDTVHIIIGVMMNDDNNLTLDDIVVPVFRE